MRILVAQIGARRHYAVARVLAREGCLERLITDACAELPPWRWLSEMLPSALQPAAVRGVLGRRVDGIPLTRLHGFPWFALSGAWQRHRGEAQTDYWARRNAEFGRLVVQAGLGAADAVYGYNGAALELFRDARRQGLGTILDQTAAPWRWNAHLLREERERWPGWEDRPAEIDESGRLSDREESEWDLADRIICGSEFAANALAEQGGPAERCIVVPYPAPATSVCMPGTRSRANCSGGPLRVLFVGTLQLRKGVPYLLESKRLLAPHSVTVRLVGPSLLSARVMRELHKETELVGPVPRCEMAEHFAWADVFVLPTLSEGSANVCYEAMAAGLPVITTASAGFLLPKDSDGVIVPTRNPEALADALAKCMENLAVIERRRPTLNTAQAFDDYAERLRQATRLKNGLAEPKR